MGGLGLLRITSDGIQFCRANEILNGRLVDAVELIQLCQCGLAQLGVIDAIHQYFPTVAKERLQESASAASFVHGPFGIGHRVPRAIALHVDDAVLIRHMMSTFVVLFRDQPKRVQDLLHLKIVRLFKLFGDGFAFLDSNVPGFFHSGAGQLEEDTVTGRRRASVFSEDGVQRRAECPRRKNKES